MKRILRALALSLLAVLAYVVLISTIVMTFLANVPRALSDRNAMTSSNTGLFKHDSDYFSFKYNGTFGPSEWVSVFIWPINFAWNFVGFTYIVLSVFLGSRRSVLKGEPPLVTVGFLFCSIITFGCTLSWLFVYDREHTITAFILLVVACWSAYAMLALLYAADFRYSNEVGYRNKGMVLLTRVLIHNGVAIYATWATVVWLLEMVVLAAFDTVKSRPFLVGEMRGALSLEDGGTIVLSIVMFKLVLWFVVENTFFEKYCRYTLTIYPTLAFILTGCYTRLGIDLEPDNYIPRSRNQIMTLVALCLTVLAFCFRIPLVIYHHRNRIAY